MKKLKFILAATAALLLTAMVFQYGCKKAELEKTSDDSAITAESHLQLMQLCVALLDKCEAGQITDQQFINKFVQLMRRICSSDLMADDVPARLRNLPDRILLRIINSNLPEDIKVCILLLQDDLSKEVEIAATNAGLQKDILAEELPDNTDPINTSEISVTSTNMLAFSNMVAFEITMNSLANQLEAAIDNWELSLGFLSMRRNYEIIMQDPNVDDSDIEDTRIGSIWFESVLTPNRKVQIGDSLYEYGLDFTFVDVTNLIDGVTERVDLTRTQSECPHPSNNNVCARFNGCCERIVNNGQNKIRGRKWNGYYYVYSEVGAKTIFFKKKPNGNWKKEEADQIKLMIDHWYQLCYDVLPLISPCAFPTCISNHVVIGINAKSVQYLWAQGGGAPAPQFCVCEYGRVHHWAFHDGKDYFNEDCHTETW